MKRGFCLKLVFFIILTLQISPFNSYSETKFAFEIEASAEATYTLMPYIDFDFFEIKIRNNSGERLYQLKDRLEPLTFDYFTDITTLNSLPELLYKKIIDGLSLPIGEILKPVKGHTPKLKPSSPPITKINGIIVEQSHYNKYFWQTINERWNKLSYEERIDNLRFQFLSPHKKALLLEMLPTSGHTKVPLDGLIRLINNASKKLKEELQSLSWERDGGVLELKSKSFYPTMRAAIEKYKFLNELLHLKDIHWNRDSTRKSQFTSSVHLHASKKGAKLEAIADLLNLYLALRLIERGDESAVFTVGTVALKRFTRERGLVRLISEDHMEVRFMPDDPKYFWTRIEKLIHNDPIEMKLFTDEFLQLLKPENCNKFFELSSLSKGLDEPFLRAIAQLYTRRPQETLAILNQPTHPFFTYYSEIAHSITFQIRAKALEAEYSNDQTKLLGPLNEALALTRLNNENILLSFLRTNTPHSLSKESKQKLVGAFIDLSKNGKLIRGTYEWLLFALKEGLMITSKEDYALILAIISQNGFSQPQSVTLWSILLNLAENNKEFEALYVDHVKEQLKSNYTISSHIRATWNQAQLSTSAFNIISKTDPFASTSNCLRNIIEKSKDSI